MANSLTVILNPATSVIGPVIERITTITLNDGWMDGWMDACMNEWMHACMGGWMDGWMNECMHGWTDRWIDGWMYGRMATSLTSDNFYLLINRCIIIKWADYV